MNNKRKRMFQCAAAILIMLCLGASACGTSAVQTGTGKLDMTTSSETTEQIESEIMESETEKLEPHVIEISESFAVQTSVDKALAKEAKSKYSFAEPSVVLDPYGTAPLTAVIIFRTREEIGGTITVKGKNPENDICGSFEPETNHIVPVYGLYNGDTTQVELTLTDGTTNTIEITTEKIDIDVGTIEIDMKDAAAYDYSDLTFVCSNTGNVYAVDGAGDIRWYYTAGYGIAAHQLENGHLMLATGFTIKAPYYKTGLQEIDLNGKVYQEYAIPGGVHHDFQELSNGNLMVCGNNPELSSVEDYIVEIDRETGEVIWELNLQELLVAANENEPLENTEEDWFHNNSLWYDEGNDLLLLSSEYNNVIIGVHKRAKTLAWIIGDPAAYDMDESYFFTPVSEEFEWQNVQHQISILDNGDLMMFDNQITDEDQDAYSRVVIYRFNQEEMTIEQVFQYGKERGAVWKSSWDAGVISLDGSQNQLWITSGTNLYNAEEDSYDYGITDRMNSSLIKTTYIDQLTDGSLTFEMKISGSEQESLTYRSFRMPLYTKGALLDVEIEGRLSGSLGITPTVAAEVSFEGMKTINTDQWKFTMDATKMTVSGSYQLGSSAEEPGDGYLVLKDGDDIYSYAITQYKKEGEDITSVFVNGWVSPLGLKKASYEIYLVFDGITYQTGYILRI